MRTDGRTGGRANGRTRGRADRRAGVRDVAVALWRASVVAACAAAPLAAQVGHPPGTSPFHDLTMRQTLSLGVGRFGGNTAVTGVGWRAGMLYAGRFDTRLSGPLDFTATLGVAASSRFRIDTEADSATRVSGPVDRTLLLADIGLVLNVTGAKTWHGVAPYVGFGAGWMKPTNLEQDPGGYNAGSNFIFVPSLGTRVFFGRTLAARLEVRDYIWRYEWPERYYDPWDLNGDPIDPPILAPDVSTKQWAHNLTLTFGLVYAFNF